MRLHSWLATVLLVLSVTLLSPAIAAADEVQLQNGDRITGEVVRLSGGTLTFKTPAGDLNIPWSTVTSLTSTKTLRVRIGDADPQTITAIATAAPGQLTLTPGGQVALATISDMGPVEPAITITGGANAGLLNSSGNTDVSSLRLDADVAVRQSANRYTVNAALNRAEDRGVDTAKNWTAAFNYDRFLTARLFLNANAIFLNDRFRDLDLRTALGLGVGYQVFEGPRVKLTANGGLGWVNEDFMTAVDSDYTAARESAALDIVAVPNRVLFFHKHDGYFGLEGDDNLFFKTSNGVRLTIVGNFITTLQLDVDYDASPSPGRDATDRTVALTFGYRF